MFWRKLVFALLCCAATPLAAQAPTAKSADPDPFGRDTPRDTIVNFLQTSAISGAATEYLEIGGKPASTGSPAARELARKLHAVLDADAAINLNAVSNRAEGNLADALADDRERVGVIHTDAGPVDILLHRVSLPSGVVWLFASETLQRIPGLYVNTNASSALERLMPDVMLERRMGSLALWQVAGLLVLLPLCLVVAWLFGTAAARILASAVRQMSLKNTLIPMVSSPLKMLLAVLLFRIGVLWLELPLLFRQNVKRGEIAVAIIATVWFTLRLIDFGSREAGESLIRRGRGEGGSIILVGRRIAKAFAIALAVLLILDNAGFDLRTVLTGLGVGGIAIALAAQRTLENVFGAIALVTDQPVRVGDTCKFGTSIGVVEDIGLRSTRIRTPDRSVISVPSGQFANMSLENLSSRERMWFHPTLSLRLDTTAAQLRQVLAATEELFRTHEKVLEGSRIRLAGFAPAAINLEAHAYIETTSGEEFLVIQEELLLRMIEIVEEAGTGLSIPGQSVPLISPPPAAPQA
jgi:MscS family membrane protein